MHYHLHCLHHKFLAWRQPEYYHGLHWKEQCSWAIETYKGLVIHWSVPQTRTRLTGYWPNLRWSNRNNILSKAKSWSHCRMSWMPNVFSRYCQMSLLTLAHLHAPLCINTVVLLWIYELTAQPIPTSSFCYQSTFKAEPVKSWPMWNKTTW